MSRHLNRLRLPLRSILPAIAVLAAAPPVHAAPLSVDFSGNGLVVPGAGFDPFAPVWPLAVVAISSYTVGGQAGWTLDSNFAFDLGTGTGTGGFSLYDGQGNSLFGLIATVADPGNGPLGGFDITYTVQGGTGSYSGFVGTGLSAVVLTSNPLVLPTAFTEAGTFRQAVPEPPAWMLATLALGLAGLARRRA